MKKIDGFKLIEHYNQKNLMSDIRIVSESVISRLIRMDKG